MLPSLYVTRENFGKGVLVLNNIIYIDSLYLYFNLSLYICVHCTVIC